jgi:glycosyltransferase involved in cell wall biosynthesis
MASASELLPALPWLVPFAALFRLASKRPNLSDVSPVSGPLLSVVVPARNESATIETVVRSVLASTYAPLELLVVDDRSTDDTAAIVLGLAAEDDRLRLVSGEPLPDGWYSISPLDRSRRQQRQVVGRRSLFDLRGRQVRIPRQIQTRRRLLDAAQQQVLDGVEADRSQLNCLARSPGDVAERKVFEQTQHLDVLAFARFAQPRFEQASQAHEFFGQLPAFQRRRLIERIRLALQQGQVMQRIEDQLLALVAAPMSCDLLGWRNR